MLDSSQSPASSLDSVAATSSVVHVDTFPLIRDGSVAYPEYSALLPDAERQLSDSRPFGIPDALQPSSDVPVLVELTQSNLSLPAICDPFGDLSKWMLDSSQSPASSLDSVAATSSVARVDTLPLVRDGSASYPEYSALLSDAERRLSDSRPFASHLPHSHSTSQPVDWLLLDSTDVVHELASPIQPDSLEIQSVNGFDPRLTTAALASSV
ncbi:hypothetical protein BV22DRAFT_1135317 [Leucogyrophana mollusca]|uniref:Uncharacterized protein n=1 Tax=Leucogyrophana mollusca TaxID=85980 RepID=A0ACB8AVN2_9AGAM|nr:hypothetical protein BV22DRAFT_1135317 [Leucogyrophana mollusca]